MKSTKRLQNDHKENTLIGLSPSPNAFDIEARAACMSDSRENFTNPNPLLIP